MLTAILTLLHVFVLVFWVGGDLGAYYASYLVADPRQTPAARRLVARMIGAIDMAPRTSLVLAVPTGLTLAWHKGWVAMAGGWLLPVWLLGLIWLASVWAVHLKEPGPGSALTRVDTGLRLSALAGFAATGLAILAGIIPAPGFIGIKLLLLAASILCGVIIRRVLPPFATAFARSLENPADQGAQAQVAALLARVRHVVIAIWTLVSLAALVGFWQPVW